MSNLFDDYVEYAKQEINPTGNPIINHMLAHGSFRLLTRGQTKFLTKLYNLGTPKGESEVLSKEDVELALSVALGKINELRATEQSDLGEDANDFNGMSSTRMVGNGTLLSVDRDTLAGRVIKDTFDSHISFVRDSAKRSTIQETKLRLSWTCVKVKGDDGKTTTRPNTNYAMVKQLLGIGKMIKRDELDDELESWLQSHCQDGKSNVIPIEEAA